MNQQFLLAAVVAALARCALGADSTKVAASKDAFFESGIVFQPGPPGGARAYAIPAIDRLPNGDLLCVAYGANRAQRKTAWVAGKLSHDGGRTWGQESVIIDSNRVDYGDPSIVVCKDRVTVISTGTEDQIDRLKRTIWSARTSTDSAGTWGPMWNLPIAHNWNCGNLQHALLLRSGTILRPFAYDVIVERYQESATEGEMVCRAAVLASTDGGRTWHERGSVLRPGPESRPALVATLDEPTAIELVNGTILMLVRTLTGPMVMSVSHDEGRSWAPPVPSPFTSCGAPAAALRVSWKPSKIIVLWDNSPDHRWPLDVAISYNECNTWPFSRTVADLDPSGPNVTGFPRQAAYPSATALEDGTIVAVWQENHLGLIKWARFNEAWIRAGNPLK